MPQILSWALPFLTVLAPSKRYHTRHHQRHKPLSDWTRQMLYQVRRWLPVRPIILIDEGSFAVFEVLWALTHLAKPVHGVTRLRLDAELFLPAPPRRPKQMGRPRKVGVRLPALTTLLENLLTPWQSIVLKDWYRQGNDQLKVNVLGGGSYVLVDDEVG